MSLDSISCWFIILSYRPLKFLARLQIKRGEEMYWSNRRRVTSKREVQYSSTMSQDKMIIAMKGFPSTGKTWIAQRLGEWLGGCPVLSVDEYLDTLSLEKGYTADSPPSTEESQRLNCLALYSLYRTARRQLESYRCIVIKSRLCSKLELDLLMWLVYQNERKRLFQSVHLVIVDCQVKNEYWIQDRIRDRTRILQNDINDEYYTDHKASASHMEVLDKHQLCHVYDLLCPHLVWYKPRNWTDLEDVKDVWLDDKAWDGLLLGFLLDLPSESRSPIITRLVVDPFDDIFNQSHSFFRTFVLPKEFLHVIQHLGSRMIHEKSKEDRYMVVHLNEMRRSLVETELGLALESKRTEKLCFTDGENCVFKYWDKLQDYYSLISSSSRYLFHNYNEAGSEADYCCGVCKNRVDPSEAAYTCHFCVLTLHESCAKILDLNFLKHMRDIGSRRFANFPNYASKLEVMKIRCPYCSDSNEQRGRSGCCFFNSQFKCRLFPTIINHACHDQHFLSIHLSADRSCEYVCYICSFHISVDDAMLPAQVKHEHGGYEHVMNLMYSHDDDEDEEEEHWCHETYHPMDPTNWFYSCQDCPSYYTSTLNMKADKIIEAVQNLSLPISQYEPRYEFTL